MGDYAEIMQHHTDPTLNDTDQDGLLDGEEIENYHTNPFIEDSDSDGLWDLEEVTLGEDGFITNPNLPDTDGDGFTDFQEVKWGTDPTDPNSKNELIWQLPLILGSIFGITTISYFIKKYKKHKFNKIMNSHKK